MHRIGRGNVGLVSADRHLDLLPTPLYPGLPVMQLIKAMKDMETLAAPRVSSMRASFAAPCTYERRDFTVTSSLWRAAEGVSGDEMSHNANA